MIVLFACLTSSMQVYLDSYMYHKNKPNKGSLKYTMMQMNWVQLRLGCHKWDVLICAADFEVFTPYVNAGHPGPEHTPDCIHTYPQEIESRFECKCL